MSELENRVALVTGAASGIGRATARRMAEHGATVILVDRTADALPSALEDLPAGAHRTVTLDVTDEAGWIDVARTIADEIGHLDILVNNAGFGTFRSIADTTLDHWRMVMAVNLDSIFLSTKYLL
ncbi:MAG: SDR family oxidoreductase, partial [Sphingomonas sp.]